MAGRARARPPVRPELRRRRRAPILHGDAESQLFLHEVVGTSPLLGLRDLQLESLYEFGSRVGFWRLMRLFAERDMRITVYAVGWRSSAIPMRRARSSRRATRWRATAGAGSTTSSLRSRRTRAHPPRRRDLDAHYGQPPPRLVHGPPRPNTRRLVAEHGGFLYDADPTPTTCPTGSLVAGKPHLVVPYTLDNNDMKFGMPQGFTRRTLLHYLTTPSTSSMRKGPGAEMMSVGLHVRLIPPRAGRRPRALP